MNSMLVALAFLTIVPIRFRRMPDNEAIARSRFWYPFVGLLLGALLAGWTALLQTHVSPLLASFLILLAWVLVTGALHLDGFCDLCDGLFGGHSPEERLRIMKDPQRGSFALIGGVLLLLGKFVALHEVLAKPLVAPWSVGLAVFTARCLVLTVAAGAKYPRPDGTGKLIVEAAGWTEATCAALSAALAAVLLFPNAGSVAVALVAGVWAGVLRLRQVCSRRLGGITGDCLGAAIEGAELLVLLGAALVL